MHYKLQHLASSANKSRGRIHAELITPYRNEFARDKDRILHSNSFRRLEYKTQVFINHEGDHYRNRLTHSLEVASIARSIARYLDLSEDLAEAISLGHDLGHTAFGHAGERALHQEMLAFGGFCHNLHTFKILVELEHRYAEYNGLNLSFEVLEGILKHNGPIKEPSTFLQKYDKILNLELSKFSSLESQISSLSDDIAYLAHDIEDSVRSSLLSFDDLKTIAFIKEIIEDLYSKHPNIMPNILAFEIARKVTNYFIQDLIENTIAKINGDKILSIDDVKNYGDFIVSFSIQGKKDIMKLKQLFMEKVYYHQSIKKIFDKTNHIIKNLFYAYKTNPIILPKKWYDIVCKSNSEGQLVEVIGNYIAGMTDRYAILEFEKIYQINFNDIKI